MSTPTRAGDGRADPSLSAIMGAPSADQSRAYRLLGSLPMLRMSYRTRTPAGTAMFQQQQEAIESARRLADDGRQSYLPRPARVSTGRRERYVGVWIPERCRSKEWNQAAVGRHTPSTRPTESP